MPIEKLSLKALRAQALRLGWIARHYRTGFVIRNRYRNLVASDPLDKDALREWLIDTLRERRRAYYWQPHLILSLLRVLMTAPIATTLVRTYMTNRMQVIVEGRQQDRTRKSAGVDTLSSDFGRLLLEYAAISCTPL